MKLIKQLEQYFEYQATYGEYIFINITEPLENQNPKELHDDLNLQINDKISDSLVEYDPEWKKSSNLRQLYEMIHNCKNCPLGYSRTNFVYGSGNPKAEIMLIGEAPGADEDAQGLPFVGKAGQLLTKILESINIKREDVYIANILKCRPPNNRPPLPTEIQECEPYLHKQIELINPKFIVILGLTAGYTLLKSKLKMSDVGGKVFESNGRKFLITYHPAALLRNPNLKRPVWEHVKTLKAMYDDYLNNKKMEKK